VKVERSPGDVSIFRCLFICACLLLGSARLSAGQSVAHADESETADESEIVAGKEVVHWSGLPVWGGKEASDSGHELPLPLGLSGNVFYSIEQNFDLSKVALGTPGGKLLDLGSLVRVTNVKVSETATTSRLDAWVLPFLNVYAIVGYVQGHAHIDVRPATIPGLRAHGPKLDFRLQFDGPTVGLGTTLAGGYRPFKGRETVVFGLADINFTRTFLDFEHVVSMLDPVDVAVLSMRLGVRERICENTPFGAAYVSLWGGGMYQGVQETMKGRLGLVDLRFRADVQAADPWSGLIGGRVELGEHLILTTEVGFGDRKTIMFELNYRF